MFRYLSAETVIEVIVCQNNGLDRFVWRHLSELVEDFTRRLRTLGRVHYDESIGSVD